MGKKYRVEYDRDGCIGVAACVAVDSGNWKMSEDNKADLNDSVQDPKTRLFVKYIDESELKKWKESAESCPVNVIHIINLETGEKVI